MDFTSKDFQIPDAQTIVQLKEMKICQKQYLEELKRREKEEQEAFQKDLQDIMKDCDLDNCKSGQPAKETEFNPMFKDILMMSTWMKEEPQDLEEFLLVPCPKGARVSITRQEEKLSEVFYKNGLKLMDLRLNIPKNTQLDAIYGKKNKVLYVLDILWFDDHDMRISDTSFRRYWLRSKFYELRLGVIDGTSGVKLVFLENYDFMRPNEIQKCFQKWPMFEGIDTDGFLFYHKELKYTKGESDRVLWLFPYMIDEVLTMFRVHKDYNLFKPVNYTTYLEYIEKFDEKMKKKNRFKDGVKNKDKFNDRVDYEKSNTFSFETTKSTKERNAELDDFCRPPGGWFKGGPGGSRKNHQQYQQPDFSQDDFFSYGGCAQGGRDSGMRRGVKRQGNIHPAFLEARSRAIMKRFDKI